MFQRKAGYILSLSLTQAANPPAAARSPPTRLDGADEEELERQLWRLERELLRPPAGPADAPPTHVDAHSAVAATGRPHLSEAHRTGTRVSVVRHLEAREF